MIDITMTVLKTVLVLVSMLSIRRLGSSEKNPFLAVYLVGIALFMTGMEMITDSATPWNFLFFEAHVSDWNNAVFGGVGLLAAAFTFYVVVAKDIHNFLSNAKGD